MYTSLFDLRVHVAGTIDSALTKEMSLIRTLSLCYVYT